MMLTVLDLFCGSGGAGMGYHLAGFGVVGVDHNLQPRYPFKFVQADALEYLAAHGHEYDLIHASPPCQRYSRITRKEFRANHPDLIGDVQELLDSIGKSFVIENVDGARHLLRNPLMLCGTMFGLNLWRHRYFETKPTIWFPLASCNHSLFPTPVSDSPIRKQATKREVEAVFGVDWMSVNELRQAIPPAYTDFIGQRMTEMLVT